MRESFKLFLLKFGRLLVDCAGLSVVSVLVHLAVSLILTVTAHFAVWTKRVHYCTHVGGVTV